MVFTARRIAVLLLVVSAATIVAATTMPWSMYYVGHSHWAQVEWVPFSRLVRPVDAVLNVLLFVPFGLSAYLCSAAGDGDPQSGDAAGGPTRSRSTGHRLLFVLMAGILLSTAVELFQVYCHGRLPTTTDVISNAVGALLGARGGVAAEARVKPR